MNTLDILTVEELMDTLKIGKNKAYELLNSGALKGVRVGRAWRISAQSVEDFILGK